MVRTHRRVARRPVDPDAYVWLGHFSSLLSCIDIETYHRSYGFKILVLLRDNAVLICYYLWDIFDMCREEKSNAKHN